MAVFVVTSIMIAACTSTPTVSQSNPSTAVCFDSAKVKGLYDEWAHKAANSNLSDGMDMAQVVASLRSTREIALELASRRPPIRSRPGTSKTRPTRI